MHMLKENQNEKGKQYKSLLQDEMIEKIGRFCQYLMELYDQIEMLCSIGTENRIYL